MILVACYNEITKWNKRENAIKFYQECVINSDGAERDRYINILIDLSEGLDECHDGASRSIPLLQLMDAYELFDTPDGSRDYYGYDKIWKVKRVSNE